MKHSLSILLCLFCFLSAQAQPKIKEKKYPSLLWEITGNGLKKPSHLIGTMHVSNKLAFHLPDSFYMAIRNAQVVALETNPETWQEDMDKYDFSGSGNTGPYSGLYRGYFAMPDDYLSINTLKVNKYERQIEMALSGNPSGINSLLYRSYGNEASDFEEDTYLDMYIFQCGKKYGKKVTGVEDYGESMKLMMEAYQDAAKDKNKKEKSYEDAQEYSIDKMQDAYRTGNLDLLDSINRYNSVSPAFDEKFLYKRNEIQANSIDSILKSGSVLFVGVGAAHLPGDRGVIEMLRSKGYKLRPVKMGVRASKEKDIVDNMRVPVTFRTETADDGFFKADIPGKFYEQSSEGFYNVNTGLRQKQFADMANGSYYMVTRLFTHALMLGQHTGDVLKKVDSLLYENVPGKILSKTAITRNGYRGFDISNRTRRGDLQRYNIFITPFEILFFKISGTGDYVKNGPEADKFFASIQLKEYKNGGETAAWKKYSPPYGGFAVDLPHDPFAIKNDSWFFDAEDKAGGNHYRVVRTDIHNYRFVEEDTFDLSLLNESFLASEFIDSQLSRRQTNHKGYPALDGKYRDKNGNVFLARFIIQGPHYYSLIAHGKQETAGMLNFLNSFEVKPFVYGEAKIQKDTSLYFSVTTPVFPEQKKIKLDFPGYGYGMDDDEEETENELLEGGAFRNRTISNDTTGEKIYVSFFRSPRYYYTKDSSELDKDNESTFADSSWVYRMRKKYELPGKIKVWESIVTDTGSSRTLLTKVYYRDGVGFALVTQSDTLTPPGAFVTKFFESFTPADTVKGVNPFQKKSGIFFADFMSNDSVLHKRAVSGIGSIDLDSTDLPMLKKAISWLNWKEKKYLDTKQELVQKLSSIVTSASADYLKELYYALGDTVEVQYTVLESLLQHRTAYAYNIFKNIINTEPPVLESSYDGGGWTVYPPLSALGKKARNYGYSDGNFLDELSDSLQLTKSILPDLLPLLNLDEYKRSIMGLLSQMVDSNLVKPADYQAYFSKFLLEAKQELKKQAIAEKKKEIEKAEESKEEKKISSYYDELGEKDTGNDDLSLYATLLLPFWETNTAVPTLIGEMLQSADKRLKYNTLLLLLQHNKPYPDSMLNYFAAMEDYRYELYTDLKQREKTTRFPAKYNNHLDLGKSKLINESTYDKPDTLVYIERLPALYKNKKGFIYFYKYKNNKEDPNWKLATVGLTPEDPKEFEYEDSLDYSIPKFDYNVFLGGGNNYGFDFTGLNETKIEEDVPMEKQLAKALKKLLYSRRKSAKEFYVENDYGYKMPYDMID